MIVITKKYSKGPNFYTERCLTQAKMQVERERHTHTLREMENREKKKEKRFLCQVKQVLFPLNCMFVFVLPFA